MASLDLSFEQFTPTKSTRQPLTLARAMAAGHAAAPRVLFLHGPAGVGKTHVLQATLRQALRERPSVRLARSAGLEVVEGLVEAFKQGHDVASHLRWEGAELIALDDLHVLARMPMMQRELARLLQEAVEAGSRVICAAGGPRSDLRVFLAALRRLPGFSLATLQGATDHDLRRILARIACREGVRPGGRALRAMVTPSAGDVRRAMGALARYRFGRSLRRGHAAPPSYHESD